MIQEEIARLTGKLVFQVDNRPLMAFEKRLNSVIGQLRQLETLANKKFNIKVQLDSRTLREQLAKAASAKVTLKDVNVSQEALTLAAKRISEKLQSTPITLNKIRVDIASLIETKKLVRTLLGQMDIQIPLKFKMSAADKALRTWKKETESKFKLHIDADISQSKFLRNVRKSLADASAKLGPVKIETPKIKLNIDRDHLKQEIRDVLAQIRRETSIRVDLRGGGFGNGGSNRGPDRGARGHAFGGGMMGAGMGFMRGAIPGLGAAFAVAQLNQINQQMQAQQNAMTAVMGSESAGKEQSQWVKNLSNTVGMDYRQVAPSYNKMLASGKTSGMSTEAVQGIFQGVSEYGRTMGLDSEAMKGSMRAIEQMMNKGQVMSEELKGQLAERMPGAISAMAEAAGFTGDDATAKLFKAMEDGEIKSVAVLEKFSAILAKRSREGGALEKAMESTAAQQARMNNVFSDSVKVFSEGGFDKGMGSFFKSMAVGMHAAEPLIRALGGAFEILIRPINALIKIIGAIGSNWERIAGFFGLTGKQLIMLGVAATAIVSPLTAVALGISAVALAVEDLMVFAEGGDSLFGRFLDSSPEAQAAFDDFVKQAGILGTYLGQAWDYLSKIVGGLEGLSFPEMFTATLRELALILEGINRVIDRFQMAGKYAEMKNPEGSTSRSMGGLQADNFEAFARGPEWARMQMEEQINRDFNNAPNQTANGIPLVGPNMQALERWAERMLAIQDPQQATNQLGDIKIVVDVKGGIMTSENLMMQMEEPMKQVALKAFGDVVGAARQTQSQVRQ